MMGAARLGSLIGRLRAVSKFSALVIAISAINFVISKALFSPTSLIVLREVDHYVTAPSLVAGDAMVGTGKLDKMSKLWPAHHHPFLYLIYSLSCVLSIKSSAIATSGQPALYDVIRKSVTMAAALFAWIAMPLRIAEMHYAVIGMDFAHVTLSYSLTALAYWALYCNGGVSAEVHPAKKDG